MSKKHHRLDQLTSAGWFFKTEIEWTNAFGQSNYRTRLINPKGQELGLFRTKAQAVEYALDHHFVCAHTGKSLAHVDFCPDCNRMDCAVPVAYFEELQNA